MSNQEKILDLVTFVKAYEKRAGLLIGGLEEVAYRKGIVDSDQLLVLASEVPYGGMIKSVLK